MPYNQSGTQSWNILRGTPLWLALMSRRGAWLKENGALEAQLGKKDSQLLDEVLSGESVAYF
jgi:hypothetical protein